MNFGKSDERLWLEEGRCGSARTTYPNRKGDDDVDEYGDGGELRLDVAKIDFGIR